MDALARPLCPCCRQPLADAPAVNDLAFIELSAVRSRVLALLIAAWPRSITNAMLIQHVYDTRRSGGPISANKCIQVAIVHLRRRLAPHGWTVSDSRGGGYRLERVR